MSFFSRILSPQALLNEKIKDYRNVVVVQATMVVSGLMLSGYLVPGNTTAASKAVTVVMSGFAAFYAFMLWDMLRNFTERIWMIRLIFIIISAVVVMGLITKFPYY